MCLFFWSFACVRGIVGVLVVVDVCCVCVVLSVLNVWSFGVCVGLYI